ncbi:MAG TPA: hypothetical protein VJ801_03110 [Polyangia bacterium]|jgi:hypothetical protein|nr:hypothetical protein [Polyangia bacterium]
MFRKLAPGLLALALAASACGKGSAERVSTCVRDWVVPTETPVFDESLVVDAPKLLWTLSLAGDPNSYGGGPVLSGDRLVLSTGPRVFFVSKDGASSQDVTANISARLPLLGGVVPWSAPTADTTGNVYFVGHTGICSLSPDGQVRWAVPYDCVNSVPYGEGYLSVPEYSPAALSSTGVLFAVACDRQVHALQSQDGSELWSAPAPTQQTSYFSSVVGGGGNHVLLYRAGEGEFVLDAATGATVGPMSQSCAGADVGASGWMIGAECTNGEETYRTCPLSLGPNGSPRVEGTYLAYLTASGERLVMFDFTLDYNGYAQDSRTITLYNRDGSIAAGPSAVQGWANLVGADETIYVSDWVGSNTATTPWDLRIIAYSHELNELWRIDQTGGGHGPYGEVLDRDGVLYVSIRGDGYATTKLFAIQTRSPGLARSSWPSVRHDNQGTEWLAEPTLTSNGVDAGPASPAESSDANEDLQ